MSDQLVRHVAHMAKPSAALPDHLVVEREDVSGGSNQPGRLGGINPWPCGLGRNAVSKFLPGDGLQPIAPASNTVFSGACLSLVQEEMCCGFHALTVASEQPSCRPSTKVGALLK